VPATHDLRRPARPIRVAIRNDVDIVLRGTARVLEPYADRVQVVELDRRRDTVGPVDVILYDTFGQAQGDVLSVDEVAGSTGACVVVFSWNTDPRLVNKALEEGAAGYVSKGTSAAALVDAIERVVTGGEAPPELVVPQDGSDGFGEWPGQDIGLRPRESEILLYIARGLTNQDIVEKAYIGMNTLKTHIRHLYRKIGVENRPQAVLWAYENGFPLDAPAPS